MNDLISLKLSTQRALTTNIIPSLRAACVRIEQPGEMYDAETIVCSFFFEGNFSYDDSEMAEDVVTEVISDFSLLMCDTKIYRVDFPQKMDLHGELVYLRYEPGYESYRSRLTKENYSELNFITIRLSLQRALLGRITSNLRRIMVWKNEEAFMVSIYYDKAPTTLELMLEKLIEVDLRNDFQAFEPPIRTSSEILPFPGKSPYFEGAWCVYCRHE